MNGFLLDTNVVSELRKKERCAPKVNVWAATVPRNQDFLSVLVVGELMRGAILKRRADPQMADALNMTVRFTLLPDCPTYRFDGCSCH